MTFIDHVLKRMLEDDDRVVPIFVQAYDYCPL